MRVLLHLDEVEMIKVKIKVKIRVKKPYRVRER